MSKSDWKKIIESKIDDGGIVPKDYNDGWTDLNSSTPIEVFTNKEKYTIELLVGDSEWDNCDESTPIENMKNFINFKDFKYRYKLKPLAPIQITEFEAEILWRYACKHGTPCTIKDYNVLTKFNGREVVIL